MPPFGPGSDPSNIVDACYPYGRIEKPKLPKYGKGKTAAQALKVHRKAIFATSGKDATGSYVMSPKT